MDMRARVLQRRRVGGIAAEGRKRFAGRLDQLGNHLTVEQFRAEQVTR